MSAHDFDASSLTRIDDWAKRYVDAGRFPGSTFLLAQRGEIVHRTTVGMRDVERGAPFEEDTIARIYSMTKPIVSVGLMTLVERGLIHLDAPLSDVLPEFREARVLVGGAKTIDDTAPCAPPTLRQLATHTAGFTYGFNPTVLGQAYADQEVNFYPDVASLEAATKKVAKMPLSFLPGTRWEYSVAIDVLGRVVEVLSGRPLNQFLREEILDPLGMNDTFFEIPDDRLDRFACCYTSIDGDPMQLTRANEGVMKLTDEPETSAYRDVSCFSGGGGLLSTIDDYYAFAEMLRKGGEHNGVRILSPATVAYMRRNHLPGDIASMGQPSFAETSMSGMGFGIGGSVVLNPGLAGAPGSIGDFSWGGIASTIYWIDPVCDLTVIFLTQLTPSSSYPARPELKALVHGAMIR